MSDDTQMTDEVIAGVLTTYARCDANGEIGANVADGLFAIADAINGLADAIKHFGEKQKA